MRWKILMCGNKILIGTCLRIIYGSVDMSCRIVGFERDESFLKFSKGNE